MATDVARKPGRRVSASDSAQLSSRQSPSVRSFDAALSAGCVGSTAASDAQSASAIDFARLYQCLAHERIVRIRRGVPAREVMVVASAMGIRAEALIDSLNLPLGEVERRARNDENLPVDQSERMLGIEYLIGQVACMVKESGNPENFDAAVWMGAWLYSPLPALGYRTAASFLDTVEGQRMVSNLLAMAQSGAYA